MRPLIAANWKMHGSPGWAEKPREFNVLFPQTERAGIDVLICPAFPFIADVSAKAVSRGILTGAQNCHTSESGAHTGEVSASMLVSVGASYVILGHSERRAAGEKNTDVKIKTETAITAGLTPVVCVGETLAQREGNQAIRVVTKQLEESCTDDSNDYVIAYEPVWAIGTGRVPTATDIMDMHETIRNTVGDTVRILYGGSVKPDNAAEILGLVNVNGVLVGGASLDMESFSQIARRALPSPAC
ncbi:MAG: triose-phosphate isomerase [Hyphomonadaceae bacterium]|nr:triose-phosphate isomerase [Hyphomonadaceae bacterium]MBC6411751.1 triose-phosphate isomerase [Hyphomonadaceae bacterium]